jgi:KUP system potassium uptake protein
MILVVSLQYIIIMLTLDNDGEGGVFALMALALKSRGGTKAKSSILVFVGIIGTALFWGDGTFPDYI